MLTIFSIKRYSKLSDNLAVEEAHVVDTQFYNEANFFYNLGPEYDVEVISEIGHKRVFIPSPSYISATHSGDSKS